MKQLKFEHQFAQDILTGVRLNTLRIDDKNIAIGQDIQIIDKVSSNKPQEWLIVGEARVTSVQEFFLKDVPPELLQKAEIGEPDKDKLLAFLRRFYGDYINDDTPVKLIGFSFTPYDKPESYLISKEPNGALPKRVLLYADGGSRGNPGPSAAGFVVQNEQGEVLKSWNKYLGITTNNQAEYHALVAGLEWCRKHSINEVTVRLDSLLVVNQMNGLFRVKNRDLWTLHESAKKLRQLFGHITFTHVPRALNQLADAEVNKALDSMKEKDIVQ